ncbi:septum site-determining protein MinC [Acetomicrobium sp. S15 = DSM 107314]|uniref:septum site-determining protein MinC n=1 Tax=Acetomicrobium sp. S15 = DSM 107314 TaxID=2529858 RepID=UPI0018E0F628
MSEVEGGILLKGSGHRIRCIIPETLEGDRLSEAFGRLVEEGRNLLEGAEVVIDLQGRVLSIDTWKDILKHLILAGGMQVVAWSSSDPATQALLHSAGMILEDRQRVSKPPQGGCKALILPRSLRSGQKVEADGDVIVFGNVNDGAEIYAGGHICVWGRLQGLAHAGCTGDEKARIAVLSLEAVQVRIGSLYSILDREGPWWAKPAAVAVQNGTIVLRSMDGFSFGV